MSVTSGHSRRSFLFAAGLATAAAAFAPRRLFAQGGAGADDGVVGAFRRDGATAKITVQPLRGGISVLTGAGGNMVVLPGPDGKVVVDAGLATARPQVSEALRSVSADPIRHLINTHWHFDHTDGNDWMHGEGAEIVAQENCRKRLATSTRVEGWKFTFPPRDPGALPTVNFKHSLTLHLNNATINLEAFSPAHTDTDLLVEFKEAGVLQTGDVWWNGHYPFIDYSTGGSIDGTILAVESCLARVAPETVIIPGHGPVGDRAQLAEFRDMLATVRERVASMKRKGMSLADVVAAKPTQEYDAKYGHFVIGPADFTGLVYAGV